VRTTHTPKKLAALDIEKGLALVAGRLISDNHASGFILDLLRVNLKTFIDAAGRLEAPVDKPSPTFLPCMVSSFCIVRITPCMVRQLATWW
jgi:hypothetical protein